jgi:hypothetical protein
MKMRVLLPVLSALLLLCLCTGNQYPLSGTETGNGSSGTVAFKGGGVAGYANVTLIPSDYVAVNVAVGDNSVITTTTDKTGRYRFRDIVGGYYNLFCEKDGYKSFVDSIYIADSVTLVDTAFLQVPGTVNGYSMYPSGNIPLNALLVVPGSLFYTRLDAKTGAFILPDLPPGRYTGRIESPSADYFHKAYTIDVSENRSDSISSPLILPGNSITSIIASIDSTVWVGTTNGLINIKKNSWSIYGILERLSNSHITCLCQNSDQTVWAGTLFRLAQLRDGLLAQNNDFIGSINTIDVRALHSSGNGQLWIGTGEGLYCNENGIWQSMYYSETLSDLLIDRSYQNELSDISVIRQHKRQIVVGTHHGLFVQDSSKKWQSITAFKNMTITSIASIDSVSFYTGTNRGLFKYTNETVNKIEPPDHFRLSAISALLDCDKRLFIGTDNGLYIFENASWSEISLSTLNSSITALACDSQKVVWIGTRNGLLKYNNDILEIIR